MIEKKYPEAAQQSMDGTMSMPAGSDMTTPPDDGSMLEGQDELEISADFQRLVENSVHYCLLARLGYCLLYTSRCV